MRVIKPSLWVFALALIASLAVHLPVYEALGVLAKAILHAPAEEPQGPVEFELAAMPGEPKPEDKPELPKPEPPETKTAEPPAKAEKKTEKKLREPDRPRPEPEKVALLPTPAPPPPTPPPPQQINEAQSVTQKSDDPSVPPPENPKFVAEENRRVLEETVAEARNLVRDDPEQQPNAAESASEEPKPGNAAETDAAHFEEHKSDDHEASRMAGASQPPTGARETAAEHDHAHGEQAQEAQAQQMAQAEQQAARAELPQQVEEIRINDGSGTFVIRRVQPLDGQQREQRASRNGAAGREGKAGQAATAPNLRLSFSQYEDTFGEGAVQDERERYAEQRKSRVAGQSREVVWKKFRGAIENYLPKVRPGNQTALNTAASPFAAYLAGVHRQIHEHFAMQFLSGLPLAGSPLSDPSLVTTLEIVINGDGTLETVGVARSSGFLPFDYGAFSSVTKAAPFPPPPSKILSGDGRVYFHWAFYRNERQCGTFNARPFILPNPDGTPAPAPSPLQDEGEHTPTGPLLTPEEGELGLRDQRVPEQAMRDQREPERGRLLERR